MLKASPTTGTAMVASSSFCCALSDCDPRTTRPAIAAPARPNVVMFTGDSLSRQSANAAATKLERRLFQQISEHDLGARDHLGLRVDDRVGDFLRLLTGHRADIHLGLLGFGEEG